MSTKNHRDTQNADNVPKGVAKPKACLAARIKAFEDVPADVRGAFRKPGSLKKIH